MLCNKWPQSWQFKTTLIYYLHFCKLEKSEHSLLRLSAQGFRKPKSHPERQCTIFTVSSIFKECRPEAGCSREPKGVMPLRHMSSSFWVIRCAVGPVDPMFCKCYCLSLAINLPFRPRKYCAQSHTIRPSLCRCIVVLADVLWERKANPYPSQSGGWFTSSRDEGDWCSGFYQVVSQLHQSWFPGLSTSHYWV